MQPIRISRLEDAYELDGYPVRITCYQVGSAFVTEVQSEARANPPIARSIFSTQEDSLRDALQSASQRLSRANEWQLTVGG